MNRIFVRKPEVRYVGFVARWAFRFSSQHMSFFWRLVYRAATYGREAGSRIPRLSYRHTCVATMDPEVGPGWFQIVIQKGSSWLWGAGYAS